MTRITSFCAVFLLALTFATPSALAKSNDKLSNVLGEIEWGDSKSDVIKKVKAGMMKAARNNPDLKGDRILLQREMKRVQDKTKKAEKSYTRLQGSETGYEVSVIADEFSTNNGESFLRVKDKVAQRFYFFIDGQFYKLVVAYNKSYLRNSDFESFIGGSVKKYGRPVEAEYGTIMGEEQLAMVEWQSPETLLRIKNKKEFFGTYTMSFADRKKVKRLQASNKKFGGNDKSEEELSAQVESLTQSESIDANADVVDSIVGSDTEVNFNEGRPKDDQIRRYGEDGKVVESEEAQASAKKKPKKKKKKKRKKKTKKPDFSDLEAKSGDDLIIY